MRRWAASDRDGRSSGDHSSEIDNYHRHHACFFVFNLVLLRHLQDDLEGAFESGTGIHELKIVGHPPVPFATGQRFDRDVFPSFSRP